MMIIRDPCEMNFLAILGVVPLLAWFSCLFIFLLSSPLPVPLPSFRGLIENLKYHSFCTSALPFVMFSHSMFFWSPADSGKRKNVLLVIAHPDDESMFFAPTLLSLASMGSYNVRILCFSNGNAEGLGTIRTQEMRSACSVLKVPQEQIEIFDHPDLQDGHNMVWNIDIIVEELKRSISLHNIGTIITFDNHGVSGHPNHIAVYRGICACLLNWEKSAGTEIKIEAWKLESTNIIVKYIGPISFLWSIWKGGCSTHMHCFYSKDLKINFAAMSRHATQWLWYRRLFVLFSFYSYTNMLHKIN